jgi:restriction system protein
MAVSTFDQLLRPVLELAAKTEITRQSATAALMEVLSLSEEERQETIPSGGATKINNSTGWAMSHLTKGGLIHNVAKYSYKASDKGLEYLKKHARPITTADLRDIEGWKEAWDAGSKKKIPPLTEPREPVVRPVPPRRR